MSHIVAGYTICPFFDTRRGRAEVPYLPTFGGPGTSTRPTEVLSPNCCDRELPVDCTSAISSFDRRLQFFSQHHDRPTSTDLTTYKLQPTTTYDIFTSTTSPRDHSLCRQYTFVAKIDKLLIVVSRDQSQSHLCQSLSSRAPFTKLAPFLLPFDIIILSTTPK